MKRLVPVLAVLTIVGVVALAQVFGPGRFSTLQVDGVTNANGGVTSDAVTDTAWGIQNQNLVDKADTETITGLWQFGTLGSYTATPRIGLWAVDDEIQQQDGSGTDPFALVSLTTYSSLKSAGVRLHYVGGGTFGGGANVPTNILEVTESVDSRSATVPQTTAFRISKLGTPFMRPDSSAYNFTASEMPVAGLGASGSHSSANGQQTFNNGGGYPESIFINGITFDSATTEKLYRSAATTLNWTGDVTIAGTGSSSINTTVCVNDDDTDPCATWDTVKEEWRF